MVQQACRHQHDAPTYIGRGCRAELNVWPTGVKETHRPVSESFLATLELLQEPEVPRDCSTDACGYFGSERERLGDASSCNTSE